VNPVFNLYDQEWPLRTSMPPLPPAKFVFATEGRCMGLALDSIVSHGCIISGGRVTRSVLSPGVRVERGASVDSCLLFSGVQVGAHSRLRNCIVDHNLKIPEHAVIGLDPETNRREGHTVTDSGLVHRSRRLPRRERARDCNAGVLLASAVFCIATRVLADRESSSTPASRFPFPP